jgi:TrmH family RNA methyltransferase
VDWTQPCALIIGGEAAGISDSASGLATGRVRIPLARSVESLNASVAGSVILFEIVRQRGMKRNT